MAYFSDCDNQIFFEESEPKVFLNDNMDIIFSIFPDKEVPVFLSLSIFDAIKIRNALNSAVSEAAQIISSEVKNGSC